MQIQVWYGVKNPDPWYTHAEPYQNMQMAAISVQIHWHMPNLAMDLCNIFSYKFNKLAKHMSHGYICTYSL